MLLLSKNPKYPIRACDLKTHVSWRSPRWVGVLPADRYLLLAVIGCAYVCGLILGTPISTRAVDLTSVTVLVKDAETGKPISQAHLTLEFREPGDPAKLKRPKFLSYSAKTNPQGRYRFVDIPKGGVRLIVTAERHQALSKNFEIEQDNAVLEVSLKKPQPLL